MDMVGYACTLNSGVTGQVVRWGFLASQPSLLGKLQAEYRQNIGLQDSLTL